ncbi:MAG: TetR/AcrR family transcriptional regulator C-terminal domain-containing protein [Acidipropionibacterium sp.]|jgi:TetR/AcrR family tetracycline transcriptional repressor|nr:TetR/AcrR family transcriptional regulator C-terminal domain-containing protein [Acidipropionibacterium sp.]
MPARRHSREDVIATALAILDEQGLEAVTVREIARRMRVNLNSVTFQVGTKGNLIALMADAVLSGLSFRDLPDDGFDRVAEISHRLRAVLLSHRDGAKLVSGTEALEQNTLRVAETMTAALTASGVSDLDNVRAAWGLFYFILGLTQEQQARTLTTQTYLAAMDGGDYPTLTRIGPIWADLDYDDRFDFGVNAIIDTLRASVPHDTAEQLDGCRPG